MQSHDESEYNAKQCLWGRGEGGGGSRDEGGGGDGGRGEGCLGNGARERLRLMELLGNGKNSKTKHREEVRYEKKITLRPMTNLIRESRKGT